MIDDAMRSVSLYHAEVSKTTPIATVEEERKLILAWQKKKDTKSRDRLVQSHLRFVIKCARKRTTDPDKLPDLIAAGNIGLLKAVDRFDVRKRLRFLTYAAWWIQEEMFKEDYATSSLVHVPTHRQKAQRKQVKEYTKALATHGPGSKQVKNLQPGPPEGTTVSLDANNLEFHDNFVTNPTQFETLFSNQRVRVAVSTLPIREQTVLNLYFGIKDDPRNFVQIAHMLGMSPERVRQIKISGMTLLADILKKDHALASTADAYY